LIAGRQVHPAASLEDAVSIAAARADGMDAPLSKSQLRTRHGEDSHMVIFRS
jgi:hypothetical protein